MEVAKYYGIRDMARIGCNDCKGCHSCCQDMGDSVALTPYDIHVLRESLGLSVDALFQEWLQLSIVDGLLQPAMAMNRYLPGESTPVCHALDEQGRCSIHAHRPSICRLFPLGREYTAEGIRYFVLDGACPAPVKTKVKIEKWVERPEFPEHEKFLVQWHSFKKKCMTRMSENKDGAFHKQLMMLVLQLFYRKSYPKDRFYEEFLDRLQEAEDILAG